jgi:hypothetical protein
MADLVTKIFRARRTVYEMLRDRGFVVSHSDLEMTLETFRLEFDESTPYVSSPPITPLSLLTSSSLDNLNFVAIHIQSPEVPNVLVFFVQPDKDNKFSTKHINRSVSSSPLVPFLRSLFSQHPR